MRVINQRPKAAFLMISAFTVLQSGCARAPGGTTVDTGNQLIITMTVAGQIRPDYYYYVLFNTTNSSTSTGPIPVVAPPWINGFASGAFTQFVRYHLGDPYANYGFYSVIPGSDLRSFSGASSPVQYKTLQTGDNTIEFRIPVSQLATTDIPAANITKVQMNFIATNRVPIDPNDPNTKLFDALGDARQTGGVNNPITISTQQAAIYQNSNSVTPEPSGDVTEAGNGVFVSANEPDLDITDWRVEVRN